LTNKAVEIAAQNCSATKYGAYTGELSPEHLIDLGLKWTILGHSERRQYYAETDDVLGKKAKLAISTGLKVIYCIGESLEQREKNQTQQVVTTQLNALSKSIAPAEWAKVVIAYEPIWAIGTGI
jgi:triosephosphate isomerase